MQIAIDIYNKYVLNGGEFNQHIFTSIPTFYETQIVKAQALENMLRNFIETTAPDIRVLDIGVQKVYGQKHCIFLPQDICRCIRTKSCS